MGILEGKYQQVKALVLAFIETPERYNNFNFSETELRALDIREAVLEYENIEDPVSKEVIDEYREKLKSMGNP